MRKPSLILSQGTVTLKAHVTKPRVSFGKIKQALESNSLDI